MQKPWQLFYIIILLICNPISSEAREIAGRVTDAYTTEALVGVNIRTEGGALGGHTDYDGRFKLNLPETATQLRFSMLGYEAQTFTLEAGSANQLKLTVRLNPIPLEGQQVDITGKFPTLNKEPEVSSQHFESREIARISGTVADLTRTLQTLPGVVAQSDFTGRMYVRGGKSEENLVMLDRTFIYEAYHLGGLVSIFNPELIEDVEFYAGGFPAKYSQAMSSVLEVQNRVGSRDRTAATLNLDVISANGVFSGPLPGPRGSWIVSTRRSYQDKLMKALGQYKEHILPNFYDYQAKLLYPLNDKHILTITGLVSGDRMNLEVTNPDSVLDRLTTDGGRFFWSNKLRIAAIDWKYLFSPNVYTHTTAALISQNSETATSGADPDWVFANSKNYSLREDMTVLSLPQHKIEAGLYLFKANVDFDIRWRRSLFLETISENSNAGYDSTRYKTKFNRVYDYAGGYVQDTWEIRPPRLSLGYGLRFDYLGLNDELTLSPRLSAAYRPNELTVIKAATGIYRQSSRDPIQTDDDIGNPDLVSQRAIHYILGAERQLSDNVKGRLELFYKDLSMLMVPDSLSNFSNAGFGESYGAEIFFQKRLSGRLDGWGSYTYSVSKRHDRAGAEMYYPLQDQRHTLSLVANYKLGRNWRLSVKGTFYTGKPYTPITGAEPVRNPATGEVIRDATTGFPIYQPLEGAINSVRFPAYHRLDVRIDKGFVYKGKAMSWYAEILNIYNYKNVFDYTYKYDYSGREEVRQFPFLPTMGLSISF